LRHPHRVEADAVGELQLLERLLEQRELGVRPPGPRQRVLAEQGNPHTAGGSRRSRARVNDVARPICPALASAVVEAVERSSERSAMGTIAGGVEAPHTPYFPVRAREDSPLGADLRRLFGVIESSVAELDPDVLVIFSSDHFHTFFVDLPIFSVGVAKS